MEADSAGESLRQALLDIGGPKTLAIDSGLTAVVSALCPYSSLKDCGVSDVVTLTRETIRGNIVYVASGSPESVKLVCDNLQKSIANDGERILLVRPRTSPLVDLILDQHGLTAEVKVYDWPAFFMPGPVLSMGLSPTMPVNELVWQTAVALNALQAASNGPFSRVTGHGSAAKRVSELLQDLQGEHQASAVANGGFEYYFGSAFVGCDVDYLLLIDRQVDWVGALVFQLTYQGLLDEIYGVSPGQIVNGPDGKVKLEGELFNMIRDLNFGMVGQRLNSLARQLQTAYDKRHDAKSIDEIREFVAKLGDLQSTQIQLKQHTALAEAIMSYVQGNEFTACLEFQQSLVENELGTSEAVSQLQELIYRKIPVARAARLLCLVCLCRSGLKEKQLHTLYNDILRTYGYEHLQTLHDLENRGLLFTTTQTSYAQIARSFQLSNQNEKVSKVYAGYTPLSVRLVQAAVMAVRGDPMLLGEYFDNVQKSDHPKEAKLRKILLRNSGSHDKQVIMVMVIGGVTYAEAAAMRAAVPSDKELIVASTSVITGDRLVKTELSPAD